MDATIKRQPRLLGLTYLSLEYQKNPTQDKKDHVYQHLITQYTLNGFTHQGSSMNIYQLAQYLHLPPEQIMKYINQTSQSIGTLVNPEQIQETMQSIISLSTTWAIQDRGQIQNQTALLLESQGNKYRAYVSSEVNKSFKLMLESNKALQEAYKTFFTSTNNQTNILNIYGESDDKEQDYVSPDQALNMLLANNKDANNTLPQLNVPHNEKLFKEHSIGETPDCLERRTGTDALRALEDMTQVANQPIRQQVTIPNQSKDIWASESPQAAHDNPIERRGEEDDALDAIP